MYCPECGTDAGEAKFCSECGADLGAYREAKAGGAGAEGAAQKGGKDRRGAQPAPAGSLGPQPRDEPSRGPSARLIWIIVGVVAAMVVGVVLFSQLGSDGETTSGGTGGDGSTSVPTTVTADTSGSYDELVKRANDLYDEGKSRFDQNDIEGGAQYFAAAAKVYAAAWKKQPGDPSVGTDWAVALFYSGDMDGAVKQVGVVLKKDPAFQQGWLNKGIFLTHQGRLAEQAGEEKQAAALYDEARQALVKAVAIDPNSDAGQAADAALTQLPK